MIEELIVYGADIDAKVKHHYLGQATPMILASKCLQVDVARVFLNYGQDVNQFDQQNRWIPLHFAASMSTESTRLLLDRGANSNLPAYRPPVFPERGPMTSLHFCVYFSHQFEGAFERVKLLIERGAYINTQTGLGNTALHLAILGRHQDVTRLSLEKGADINLENNQEKSAVQLAQERGHFSWFNEVRSLTVNFRKLRHCTKPYGLKISPVSENCWNRGRTLRRKMRMRKHPWTSV